MLFKLSLGNIRKSLRDYAIYFFTLVIGVSIFYVFNTVGEQAAMMRVSESRDELARLLTETLSGVSVFVAFVLGLLIVYASRFLMKRRNREFALYMTLGMSKRRISTILLLETVFVGIFSLVIGLALGVGLSQLMSAVVANLFDVDMTAYHFLVSKEAIGKTILYFAAMYLVVIAFNSTMLSRTKLIDLLQAGRKAERVRLKSPVLCILLFLAAAAMLGYAYYQVGWNFVGMEIHELVIYIVMGASATFLIFWSAAGMLLRIVRSMKGVYYRGLNAFTFRQISSKVNTMVVSMTVICLMLFVTICALTSSFSVRNSLNAGLASYCPADVEIEYRAFTDDTRTEPVYGDVTALYEQYGYDLTDALSDYVHFPGFEDPGLTFGTFLGDQLEAMQEQYPFLLYDTPYKLYRLSDYNALMRLYGKEEVPLEDGEYILMCNFKSMRDVIDDVLYEGYPIHVMGSELVSRYADCQDGFVDLATQSVNAGLFIVPDAVAAEAYAHADYLIGQYAGSTKEELADIEQQVREATRDVLAQYSGGLEDEATTDMELALNTKQDIAAASVGLGAILAFLGLYIGLVFLIACGVILALKELSENVDSAGRYEMLRKIGVEEKDIARSMFRQTGLFFLFPLLLACIHSVFGMKFATQMMEVFGTQGMWQSILVTSALILLIYGGYFLITLYSSRQIVREKR